MACHGWSSEHRTDFSVRILCFRQSHWRDPCAGPCRTNRLARPWHPPDPQECTRVDAFKTFPKSIAIGIFLRAAQRTVFGSRFRRIESEPIRLEAEVQAAQARLADISESTATMETEFAASRELEQQRAKQLEAQREELSGLRIDEERMRERREHQVGTISDNAVRQRQASEELEGIAQRVQSLAHV